MVNNADTDVVRLLRREAFKNLPSNLNGTHIREISTGDYLNKGRFPSTILPYQGVDFPFPEIERHIRQSMRAAKSFINIP